MPEAKLLANCVVGLGFSRRGFAAGLERGPDLIGCDAGSADFGPGFLGSGKDPKSAVSVHRDLDLMIAGAQQVGSPLVVGSCGGAGADIHLAGFREIVAGIAAERGRPLKVALIHAELAPEAVLTALADGRIRPLGQSGELTEEAVGESTHIVGMIGAGPFMDALAEQPDVVLAGRCCDPAIYAGLPLSRGIDAGVAWHAAKSIDKGYLATTEPQRGSPVLATLGDDGFTVEPMLAGATCTPESVARITMHENPNPFEITQPSGTLVVTDAQYEALDDRRVRVTGSRFAPAVRPSIKLEGARRVGHRAVMIAGIRDPRLLGRLEEFLTEYRRLLERVVASLGIEPGQWSVRLRPYGYDAVLGGLEQDRPAVPHEVGLVVDVVAETESMAVAIAGRSAATGSRLDITGRLGGGGNFAYPFSPNVLRGGEVYQWSIWHTMAVDDERSPFRIELVEL
jgi:hypothetical protein